MHNRRSKRQQHHTDRPPPAQLTTRCDDRRAVQNFPSPQFGTKLQRKVLLFLQLSDFPFNIVYDRRKKASVRKKSPSVEAF